MARRGEVQEYFRKLLETKTDDCIIWPYRCNNKGYGEMSYEGKHVLVNYTLLKVKTGLRPKRRVVAHSCANGHKGCVNVSHMRWATYKENSQDMIKHGNSTRGSKHSFAKLNEEQVLTIYRDNRIYREIAKDYTVSRGYVTDIKCGNAWAWLTGHNKAKFND